MATAVTTITTSILSTTSTYIATATPVSNVRKQRVGSKPRLKPRCNQFWFWPEKF